MDDSTIPLRCCKQCGNEYPATPQYFHRNKKKYLHTICRGCRNLHGWPASKREGFKNCTYCYQELPATQEFFRLRGNNPVSLASRCRDCTKASRETARRDAGMQPRKISIVQDGMKQCVQCECWKPATPEYFNKSRRNKDGLIGTCKECRQVYFDTNKEKAAQRSREWYRANPDRAKLARKLYAESHPDLMRGNKRRYFERNRDTVLARRKRHYHENKAAYKVRHHIRYNLEYGLPNNYTSEQWVLALDYFNHRCAVCGRPPGLWHTLAQDHWIPLTHPDCPGTVIENIIPLCHGSGGCNNSKWKHNAEDWLIQKWGRRKATVILKRINDYFMEAKKRANMV